MRRERLVPTCRDRTAARTQLRMQDMAKQGFPPSKHHRSSGSSIGLPTPIDDFARTPGSGNYLYSSSVSCVPSLRLSDLAIIKVGLALQRPRRRSPVGSRAANERRCSSNSACTGALMGPGTNPNGGQSLGSGSGMDSSWAGMVRRGSVLQVKDYRPLPPPAPRPPPRDSAVVGKVVRSLAPPLAPYDLLDPVVCMARRCSSAFSLLHRLRRVRNRAGHASRVATRNQARA
nr:hypothetical protein CFP56_19452 [Quercus suber]